MSYLVHLGEGFDELIGYEVVRKGDGARREVGDVRHAPGASEAELYFAARRDLLVADCHRSLQEVQLRVAARLGQEEAE